MNWWNLLVYFSILNSAIGRTVTWKSNTNYNNTVNWNKGHLPCLTNIVVFPSDLALPVELPSSVLEFKELVLPRSGILVLSDGGGITLSKKKIHASCSGGGGRYVESGEYPSAVSIQYYAGAATCGGIIINPLLILTACHCIVTYNEKEETVTTKKWKSARMVAGSTSRYPPLEPTAQVRFIFRWTRHPRCVKTVTGDWEFDFAAVVPTQKFVFNEYVAPGRLVGEGEKTEAHQITDEYIKSRSSCIVLGWGTQQCSATNDFKPVRDSQFLKLAEVYLLDDVTCAKYFCTKVNGCNEPQIMEKKGRLCALGGATMDSPCVGDSGGPLYCDDYLTGVISQGTGCSQFGHPLIYGRLDAAIDFILNTSLSPMSMSTASTITFIYLNYLVLNTMRGWMEDFPLYYQFIDSNVAVVSVSPSNCW